GIIHPGRIRESRDQAFVGLTAFVPFFKVGIGLAQAEHGAIADAGNVLQWLLVAKRSKAVDSPGPVFLFHATLASPVIRFADKRALRVRGHGIELGEGSLAITLGRVDFTEANTNFVGQLRRWFLVEPVAEKLQGWIVFMSANKELGKLETGVTG